MLSFREYMQENRNSRLGWSKLAKLPKLQKLAKLPRMNPPHMAQNSNNETGPNVQTLGPKEAIIHLQRIIAQLSVLIRRLSQE
jgi:hypothetical protein